MDCIYIEFHKRGNYSVKKYICGFWRPGEMKEETDYKMNDIMIVMLVHDYIFKSILKIVNFIVHTL